MSLYTAVERVIQEAEEQDRPIAQIRVTAVAIPGSITAAPMTPERARALGHLLAAPSPPSGLLSSSGRRRNILSGLGRAANEIVVFGDPGGLLEVLIHPGDWRELLTEEGGGRLRLDASNRITRLCEIPVCQ